jgi:uncharacterized membrane protein
MSGETDGHNLVGLLCDAKAIKVEKFWSVLVVSGSFQFEVKYACIAVSLLRTVTSQRKPTQYHVTQSIRQDLWSLPVN